MDGMLMYIHKWLICYHSLRGARTGVWQSIKSATIITNEVYEETSVEDYQKGLWKSMSETAEKEKEKENLHS